MNDINLQQLLSDMEDRIREDFASTRADMSKVDEKANATNILVEGIDTRVEGLEQKMNWLFGGLGTGLLSLVGFVWHSLTGGPK